MIWINERPGESSDRICSPAGMAYIVGYERDHLAP